MKLPNATLAIVDSKKISDYCLNVEIQRDTMKAVVRTGWIIKRNETQPRLTTCYVK